MKTTFFSLVLVMLTTMLCATAFASNGWIDNFQLAKEKSHMEGKPILADFTGSDWCGWCIDLKKEVFDTSKFKDYADKNLILFEADFPFNKKQTNEVKQQNKELQKKYGVRGFPTVILMDSDGNVLKQKSGFMKLDRFIAFFEPAVKSFMDKSKSVDSGGLKEKAKVNKSTETISGKKDSGDSKPWYKFW